MLVLAEGGDPNWAAEDDYNRTALHVAVMKAMADARNEGDGEPLLAWVDSI